MRKSPVDRTFVVAVAAVAALTGAVGAQYHVSGSRQAAALATVSRIDGDTITVSGAITQMYGRDVLATIPHVGGLHLRLLNPEVLPADATLTSGGQLVIVPGRVLPAGTFQLHVRATGALGDSKDFWVTFQVAG